MGIFDLFKKAKTNGGRPAKTVKPFEWDKAKYQWDSSAEEYCRQFNKTMDELEADDYDVIDEYAANHIAFFLTWIIQNGFYTTDAPEDILEAAEAVKHETMTGTAFLTQYCDGVLNREDLSPEIRGFADFYYDPDYLNDYTSFVENDLRKTVPGIGFTWEEYHQFRHVMDHAYKMYLKR